MTTSFGPWTSGMHTGSPQKMLLTSHWKRRLNLLGPTCRFASAVSGRTWGIVLAVGLLLGLLPGIRPVPAESNGATSTTSAEKEKPGKKKVRPGFIYSRGIIFKEGRAAGMRAPALEEAARAYIRQNAN